MKKKLDLKSMVVGIIAGSLLFGGIVTASTALSNVFQNQYPIYANGNYYNPTMPILNYQGRTYVPLTEFGTLTNSSVKFINNTIYVDSNNYSYNNNNNYNSNYYPTKNYSNIDIEVGETENFYINLNKYGATSANITYGSSYIRLSKSYVTYSDSITVTGREEGDTAIVITYNTGNVDYIYVTVEDEKDKYEDEFELEIGETASFYIDLDDYDASKATLSYDSDYVKLSKTTLYSSGKVTITAKEEGDTTIKIKYNTGDVDYIYVEIYDENEDDEEDRSEMELDNYSSISYYINLDYYDAEKATISYDSNYVKLSKTTFYSSDKVTITAKKSGETTLKIKYDSGDVEYIDLIID